MKPIVQERIKYKNLDIYYKNIMKNLNTIDPDYVPEKSEIKNHMSNIILIENKFKNRDVIDFNDKIENLIKYLQN